MVEFKQTEIIQLSVLFNPTSSPQNWNCGLTSRRETDNSARLKPRFTVRLSRTIRSVATGTQCSRPVISRIVYCRKKTSKPKHTRLKFDLEKLKDPNVLETFQAMIRGRFGPLTIMSNEDIDIDSMITTFNTAVTETASEILGKHRQKKKTLDHCRSS